MNDIELFCKFNNLPEEKLDDLLDKNSVKYRDLLVIDTIQFPTITSSFDSPFYNERTFITQVNRVITANKDIYLPKYMIFFHAAAKNLENTVLENGLLPTSAKRRRSYQSTDGYVYLAINYNSAVAFGELANSSKISVFAALVKTTDIHIDKDQLRNKRSVQKEVQIKDTLGDSMWYGRSVRYKGKISPYQIVLL